MNDIVIYGAGGFGRETALLIHQISNGQRKWNLLGFCDDGRAQGDIVDKYPIIGGLEQLNTHPTALDVVLAIADPRVRKRIRASIHNKNILFPTLIHPSVSLGASDRNSIGEGTIICAGSIITTNVHIGNFNIINLMCSIGHDVVLGDFCSIMPGCSLSGFDSLGSEVFVGSGARILPNVRIGTGSKVGAGAVVLDNVPAGTTVVGVPAKIARSTEW